MGDFIGFKFGGKHISDFGIIRVSGGDRYEEELQPEIKDITAEVAGIDGNYYFGSNYGPRKFSLELAFDSLTEENFRALRKLFSTKQQKELIFDERPYKKYIAKLESPIELSYVCFEQPKKIVGAERDGVRVALRTTNSGVVEQATAGYGVVENTTPEPIIVREKVTPYEIVEGQHERIYKGEGKITFVCYFPFAKSAYKQLPVDEEESDWAISSGILSATDYANFDKYTNGVINIYNAGDVETGFRMYLPSAVVANNVTLAYKSTNLEQNPTASLVLNAMTLKTGDVGVLIDTINQLIMGISSFNIDQSGNAIYVTSGNIYNEYVNSGYFFHLEPNSRYDGATITITGGAQGIEIFYDYLYF